MCDLFVVVVRARHDSRNVLPCTQIGDAKCPRRVGEKVIKVETVVGDGTVRVWDGREFPRFVTLCRNGMPDIGAASVALTEKTVCPRGVAAVPWRVIVDNLHKPERDVAGVAGGLAATGTITR